MTSGTSQNMEVIETKHQKERKMKTLLNQLIPLVAVVSAAVLAYAGVSGWGWFLLIAFLSSGAGVVQEKLSR